MILKMIYLRTQEFLGIMYSIYPQGHFMVNLIHNYPIILFPCTTRFQEEEIIEILTVQSDIKWIKIISGF